MNKNMCECECKRLGNVVPGRNQPSTLMQPNAPAPHANCDYGHNTRPCDARPHARMQRNAHNAHNWVQTQFLVPLHAKPQAQSQLHAHPRSRCEKQTLTLRYSEEGAEGGEGSKATGSCERKGDLCDSSRK